jgi:DNA replication and repair protein RecF
LTRVAHLWLTDFRCYRETEVEFPPGLTVLEGGNGRGKTSLLEAVHWLATTSSFRGVPDRVLIREGADRSVIRARLVDGEREELLEAELVRSGRARVLRNHQPLRRTRDLLGALRVTIFAPDDLELVKGAPRSRRAYLDGLLVALAPRHESTRAEYERVLKHRNALLRRGVRGTEDETTLAVFDDQLVGAGSALLEARLELVDSLARDVRAAHAALAGDAVTVEARYEAPWVETALVAGGSADVMRRALAAARSAELARGLTLVGPHRDDWRLLLSDREARTEASQGEQRTLALALRLGGHRRVSDAVGEDPVLMLDDVFSELDPTRAQALVANLPKTQTLLTTAVPPPPGVTAALVLEVGDGVVRREPGVPA